MTNKTLKIKLKSSQSKKSKTKKIVQQTTVVKKSQLQHWLDSHEQIWHDDDYDAGKDW